MLAVTAPLALPSSAGEGIAKLTCSGTKEVPGGPALWQRFGSPRFEPGLDVGPVSQAVVSYAVSPSNSSYIAVTNGNSIYVSKDGGCSFRMSFRLDRVPSSVNVPLSGVTTAIKSVFVAPGSNTFFALAEELETGATVGRPHVLRSTTGTNPTSWTLADDGLPPIGKPLVIKGHRTNRNVLYLTFAGAREESQCPPQPVPCDGQQGRRLGLMYASVDGGRTWQSRTDPSDLNSIAAIKYLSVDDDDPRGERVWVVANGRLFLSRNGGRSYEAPDGLDQSDFTFTAVESLARTSASRGLELVAFSAQRGMLRLQRGKWIRSDVPFNAVEAVAQRPEGDIAVVTSTAGGAPAKVWRIYPDDFIDFELGVGLGGKTYKLTYGWEELTPAVAGLAAAVGSGAAPRGAGTYYVRENNQLLRFLGSRARLTTGTAPGVELDAPPPPKGRITPPVLDIDLPVGKTTTVDYTLTLPPAPTPLDVYLLVDNSGSMLPFIEDLKDNLGHVARALNDSGVDVAMGLGRINVQPDKAQLPVDNPRTEEDESKPRPIYERLRPVGPINQELFTQLGRFDGNSGSGSEPQLEALWQSITGKGLSLENLGPLIGYSIPPGQDAGFREALSPIKVIVHATDEKFSTNIEGPAHNDPAVVARTLADADVKQIGLSLDNQYAAKDLRYMARATGAIAPRGGTDCDGDGHIGPDDVREGRPLVCGQSIGLDKTLVNLLRSLSDPATITLSRNNAPTMVAMSRTSFRIDAKQSTRVSFSVTYSCKGLEAGQYSNDITAALRGLQIAKAVATVNCGGLTTPPRPPAIVAEPGNPPPPAQPQPIAPAPVPVNPVPQPQTQVQGQTQLNPQAGMADQEEQQFQLAVAGNDAMLEDEDQLAMSGLSYEDAALGVLGAGMGLATAVGVGVALRRRSRTASAKVTVRR